MVLPPLDGFPLLAAGMTPFIMIGVKLITNPHTAGIGAGYNIMFGNIIGVENITRFDPLPVLNDGCASLLGAGVAALVFALLVPAETRRLRLHLVRSLRRRALLACFGSLRGLRHRFENSTRDLLGQLLAGADRTAGEDRRLLGRTLSVLEAGHAIIDLREASVIGTLGRRQPRRPARLRARAGAPVREAPTQQRREQALGGRGARHQQDRDGAGGRRYRPRPSAPPCKRGRVGLHLLRTVLLDDETFATLSSVENPATASLAGPGASHAA